MDDENLQEEFDKLTEKQKRFIDYFIETGNATEASKLANYKGKNLNRIGSENLSKLDKFIKWKMQSKNNERIASQDEILEFLTRVIRGEEKDQFDLDASLQDRIKSVELLGKRYGTWVDKKNVDLNTEIKVTLIDD